MNKIKFEKFIIPLITINNRIFNVRKNDNILPKIQLFDKFLSRNERKLSRNERKLSQNERKLSQNDKKLSQYIDCNKKIKKNKLHQNEMIILINLVNLSMPGKYLKLLGKIGKTKFMNKSD